MPTDQPSRGTPGFGILLILFVSFRILALFLLRTGGFFGDFSDFNYYREMAELSDQGYYPFIHYWVEYPPVFPWLIVAAHRVSLLVPPWPQPLFWFQLIVSGLLILADIGNLWLIRRIGRRIWGEDGGLRCAWIYAGLFLPAHALVTWFDTLPVFWMLLALDLLLARRVTLSGLACGVGFAVKVFPALVAGPGIRVLSGIGSRIRFGLAAAASVVAIAMPFLISSPEMLIASLRGMLARGTWMTPWALVDGYYGPGVVASLGDRLFYAESALWTNPTHGPWWALNLVIVLICALVYTRPIETPRDVVALTGFTLTTVLLLSKGFSQQFTVWLLPFIVVLAPTGRGLLLAVALIVNNILVEGYLYMNTFPDERWVLQATVLIRTTLLALLAVELGSQLFPAWQPRWGKIKSRMAPAVLAIAVVIGALLTLRMGSTYWDNALRDNPYASTISALRSTSADCTLLFLDRSLYTNLYSFIQPRKAHLVTDERLPDRVGVGSLHARLQTLVGGKPEVVMVRREGEPQTELGKAVHRWLSVNYHRDLVSTVNEVTLERYVPATWPAVEPATFGTAIVLTGYSTSTPFVVDGPDRNLSVRLRWQALASIDRDYTVFIHVVDTEDRIIDQWDSMPLNNKYPTGGWRAGEEVSDLIELSVAPEALADDYRVFLGVYYYPTMERLPVQQGDYHGDRILIGSNVRPPRC